MNEAVKEEEVKEGMPLQTPVDNPEVTKEQLMGQLNYAQKLINVLQKKVNELNGQLVQLEAQLAMANEDREGMLKQLEPIGIAPSS
jgi:predicted  nucleic acid-binding Zn-ribbon protein